MKIWAMSKDGQFVRIGENRDNCYWYSTLRVKTEMAVIKKGDTVQINYGKNSENKLELTFIKKLESISEPIVPVKTEPPYEPPYTSTGSTDTKVTFTYPDRFSNPKTPEESDSIRRQAIGHMVSRTLIGMTGKFDVSNVDQLIDKLYAKYTNLVS